MIRRGCLAEDGQGWLCIDQDQFSVRA